LRRPLDVHRPSSDRGIWVTRADALPPAWQLGGDQVVWAAGTRTWLKLAARGTWVHGCADGLGDSEAPAVDRVAGRPVSWHRLTHADAQVPDAVATYVVEETLPADLPERSHFFWTSGTTCRRALERWPMLRDRWHGSGPGRTRDVVADLVGDRRRVGVWLDYDDWYREVVA
jgi:hypothetical protein